MKKIILVCVFSLISSISLAKDTKEGLALQLLELSHMQETVDATISSYSVQLQKLIPSLTTEELNKYFQLAMGWEVSKPALLKVTMDLYTEDELKGVVEFLQSPIGKSYSQKSAVFSQKFLEITESNFQQAFQYLQQQLKSKQQ